MDDEFDRKTIALAEAYRVATRDYNELVEDRETALKAFASTRDATIDASRAKYEAETNLLCHLGAR